MRLKTKIFWGIFILEFMVLIPGIIFYPEIFEVQTQQQINVIEIDQPFIIKFNQPIIPLSLEKSLSIVPEIESYQIEWREQNKQVLIIPQKKLDKGKVYEINFSAKSYAWTKLDQAQFLFVTKNISYLEAHQLPLGRAIKKIIKIDLANQKLSIWQDDKKIGEYLVSTGKSSTPTRRGNFSVLTKLPIAYGSGDGQIWKMPYWLGIYKAGGQENGIHELPFINGYREGASSLGHAVSHGCVRLAIGDAERVWNWANIGTPVIIY